MANRRLYQLSHCTCYCRYHIVWTPRFRGKILADEYIKQELKRMFKMIAKWKGFQIVSWHIGDEHIHLFISIPHKFSVLYAVSILKGKSSAWIKKKNKSSRKDLSGPETTLSPQSESMNLLSKNTLRTKTNTGLILQSFLFKRRRLLRQGRNLRHYAGGRSFIILKI